MSNTSATGGYLTPSTTPLTRVEFENLLYGFVVGVCSLDNTMVRPRWQEVPAPAPARSVTWCSIGVLSSEAVGTTWETHDTDASTTTVYEQTTIKVQASFYGPEAGDTARTFVAGAQVEQNRSALRAKGVALQSFESPRRVPELVNSGWIQRYDVDLTLNYIESRTYAIGHFLGDNITVKTDTGSTRKVSQSVSE